MITKKNILGDKYINDVQSLNRKEGIESNSSIDLHTHTNYSDGDLNPNELIKEAVKNNVSTIAITDHDTILGLKNIKRNYDETQYVNIIPGIELTAKVDKGRMHILGYNIDINNKYLNDKLIELKNNSFNSCIAILSQINKDYGIRFSYEDLKKIFNSCGNIGRPDIAKLCIKYGYANSVQDAFDKYLIEAHKKINKLKKGITYEECLDLIIKSGGIPVLAHPKSLELNEKDLLLLIKDMIKYGLQGIEVYHTSHNQLDNRIFLNIASKYDLLISGGSDYHGSITKPNVEIGKINGECIKKKKLTITNVL